MKIGPKISTAVKKIGKGAGKCLVKGVGIGALGLVAWDCNVYGKLKAEQYAQKKDAQYMINSATNTLFEADPSIVTAKIKQERLNLTMRENVRHFFNRGIGYIGGFIHQMVNDVIPLALGVGTLLTKGKWSKGFAAATGIYGLIVILKDGFGLGHSKNLNNPF